MRTLQEIGRYGIAESWASEEAENASIMVLFLGTCYLGI